MLFVQIRNAIVNAIPGGTFAAEFVYIGMIIFMLCAMFMWRKWLPFVVTCVVVAILSLLEFWLAPQHLLIVNYIPHMLVLPLIITLFYHKRA